MERKDKIRAAIIDDEPNSIRVLELELARNCPEVELLGSFLDPIIALEEIKNLQPELLFLDIEMPFLTGFDVAEILKVSENLQIIFVTAHDHYAIQALRKDAVDYLLKPVNKKDLISAIERFKERRAKQLILSARSEVKDSGGKKIAFPTFKGLKMVSLNDIVYCEADNNYTFLHMADKKKMLVTQTLLHVMEMLPENSFYRCHRSYAVKISRIEKYIKSKAGSLEMDDGSEVPVSRQRKKDLLKLLSDRSGLW